MLESIVVDRPSKTKILKRAKGSYVYLVVDSIYIKEKQYTIDKKVCIGKLVPGSTTKMYPNDNYFKLIPDAPKPSIPDSFECEETNKENETVVNETKLSIPSEAPKDLTVKNPDSNTKKEKPESQFEYSTFADTLNVGTYVAIHHIIEDLGIDKILSDLYSNKEKIQIIDVISALVTSGSDVFSRYPAFSRRHLQQGTKPLSDVAISRLLANCITSQKIEQFLYSWNNIHLNTTKGINYIHFDNSNFNHENKDSELAEMGHAKDDPIKPQVNFSVAMTEDEGIPLDYDVYQGSIPDISTCEQMIDRIREYGYNNVVGYGYNNVVGVFDRAYFCENNVINLFEKDFSFIMMTSNNLKLISDLIVKNMSELRDKAAYHYDWKQSISSLTVKGKAFDKEVYFHLYRDINKAAESQEKIYTNLQILKESLDEQKGKPIRKNMDISKYSKYFELNIEDQEVPSKKPRKNSKPKTKRVLVDYEFKKDEIDKEVNLCGCFCIVASHESDSVNALKIYRHRDIIEKFFRGIKWGMSFNTPGVHTDQNLIAKVHLIFLASIVRNRLLQVSRELKEETKNKRNFTVTGMIDLLEQVDAIFSENSRKYERKHELSSKNKLIFDKLSISVQDIDDAINAFNKRVLGF